MNMRKRMGLAACVIAFAMCLTAVSPTFTVQAENSAPVAENMELVTYKNVSLGGRLSALDPDGDAVSFKITTEPSKGSVELTEDGRFVYSPNYNKSGRDYFGYKAIDAEGNESQEATVIIKIEKQKEDVSYSDMEGDGGHYAAVRLAEEGIYFGERLGDSYVFRPDEYVTRGDFLAMSMQSCDIELLSGVVSTGFTDDESIPYWQKPYVATAMMDGIINGYSSPEGTTFTANGFISYSEAAVLLNSVLDLTDVSNVDTSVPTWAAQAMANVEASGIVTQEAAFNKPLTRIEAAEMIVGALEVLENRVD